MSSPQQQVKPPPSIPLALKVLSQQPQVMLGRVREKARSSRCQCTFFICKDTGFGILGSMTHGQVHFGG